MPTTPALFDSFLMAGFEGSSHRRPDGAQLDLIAASRHDAYAVHDYQAVRRHGLRTVRDALRWHLIAAEPGRFDWSSARPMLRAARRAGVQVIWDLCHYGVPRWLDVWSADFAPRFAEFAAAAARVAAEEGVPPLFCPVNEISFWSWAGGEEGWLHPGGQGRGGELKRQLVRAAIAGIDAIRRDHPAARFLQAEPLIHVSGNPDLPETAIGAAQCSAAQFEAFDMIAGRSAAELGGTEAHLDVLGLNYYPENQQMRGGGVVPLGHLHYRPLRELLADVHARYARAMVVAETGAENGNGPGWLRYVAGEAQAARRAGLPIKGLCLYPVLDYPGWHDGRHCRVGLLRADETFGARTVDPDMAHEVAVQVAAFALPKRRRPAPARSRARVERRGGGAETAQQPA